MDSLKRIIVKPMQSAALVTGMSAHLARQLPVLRILMLHGVGPDDLAVDALTAQLTWLARNFRVVRLHELIAKVADGTAPTHEVALTFDDGLRCHAEVVAPLLLRMGLPATFFVCPTLIEERRWLWNHEARTRLGLLTHTQREALAVEVGTAPSDVESMVEWMKTVPLQQRQSIESIIRERTVQFAPSPAQRARFDPLTWDQLRSLDTDVFTIGSHTATHPILTTLDEPTLQRELRESRDTLENRLDRDVDLFCYPNGSQDQHVRQMTAQVYRAAVSTESGFVNHDSDLHRLARVPIADDVALLGWRMHRPSA